MRLETVPENGAFIDSPNLTEVEFADDVRRVGMLAFKGCTNLRSVSFGERMETIGASAFRDCAALELLEFPDSVAHIGGWAFRNCTSLKSVLILSEHGLAIDNGAFWGCTSLKDVVIESGVSTIEEDVFRDCTSIEEVEFSGSVTQINQHAFSGCTKLRSICFLPGEEMIQVADGAFSDCAISAEEVARVVEEENQRRREAALARLHQHVRAPAPHDRRVVGANVYGRTLFVCVNNTWGVGKVSDVTHQRVSLKDCAMGYWYIAGSLRARQAEFLMAVCHGTVQGVWRINQDRGWRPPALLPKPTWPEDQPVGGRVGCELIDVSREEWEQFVGSRPSDAGIEMRGGHIHYSFTDADDENEVIVPPVVPMQPVNIVLSPHATRDVVDGVEIILDPGNTETFKHALIAAGRAERTLVFANGGGMTGTWRAERFTMDSSLIANIRTSNYFRRRVETGLRQVILRITE